MNAMNATDHKENGVGVTKNKVVNITTTTATTSTTTRAARRNGLYLTNKELNEYNLARSKFGPQLSLSDLVNNSSPIEGQQLKTFSIHEDVRVTDPVSQVNSMGKDEDTEEDEDEDEEDDELRSTLSNNSALTINRRSSIPYVNNRYSSTSSYNGSSVRNSKRISILSVSSSDSDEVEDGDATNSGEDEDFNRCFFNNPHGRTRNITAISIHSNSSEDSVSFAHSTGGKPGLVGYEAPILESSPPSSATTKRINSGKKAKKTKKHHKQQHAQQPAQHHQAHTPQQYQSTRPSSSSIKRFSQISGSSSLERAKRNSLISTASSDRSSKRYSLISSWRYPLDSPQQQKQPIKPPKVSLYQPSRSAGSQISQIPTPPPSQTTSPAVEVTLSPPTTHDTVSLISGAESKKFNDGESSKQKQQQHLQQQRSNLPSISLPSVSQPSSSKIHRLMHSVSIRSGLFKMREPAPAAAPEEKKVQLKRSFFSIRSGLNRSTSTMDIGSAVDRKDISLPVPQGQTQKKLDNKLKNSSSIYSLANR